MVKKPGGKEQCKNGAPWQTVARSRFVVRRKKIEFAPQRNDPLLNNVPRRHFVNWRANSDVEPVISIHALLWYLTKYLTKAEVTSEDMKGTVDSVLKSDPDASAASVYIKLLNKTHSRDYSAQEVTHHVLKLPGVHCNHTFQIASSNDEVDLETGAPVKSAYHSYLDRRNTASDANREYAAGLCFYDWVCEFQVRPPFSRRRNLVIPRIFPAVNCKDLTDKNPFHDWCVYQLRCTVAHEAESEIMDIEDPAQRVRVLLREQYDATDFKMAKPRRKWRLIHTPAGGEDISDYDDEEEVEGENSPFRGQMPDVGAAGSHTVDAPPSCGLKYADEAGWTRAYATFGRDAAERMATFTEEQEAYRGDSSYDDDLASLDPGRLNAKQRKFYNLL